MFLEYYNLETKLGGAGASNKVAQLIYNTLNP